MLPVDGIKGALVQHRSVKKQVKKLFKKQHGSFRQNLYFCSNKLTPLPARTARLG